MTDSAALSYNVSQMELKEANDVAQEIDDFLLPQLNRAKTDVDNLENVNDDVTYRLENIIK